MTDVTYIRVTIAGVGPGAWIPIADLDLLTENEGVGSRAAGSLSFTLAGDDAAALTLDRALDRGDPVKIEVATYDSSSASSTSAGTLLAYASSTSAYVTTQKVAATTQAASYGLSLGNISQTSYPGGTASSSAFDYTRHVAVVPTAVPGDVVTGASVAGSTSVAPPPSSLSYYAQFKGANGSFLQDEKGSTWFSVSHVAHETENEAVAGAATSIVFSPLSFQCTNQSILAQLYASLKTGSGLTVHLEAIDSASAKVIDNTTYSTARIASTDSDGNIGLDYGTYYTTHASGTTTTSYGYNRISKQVDAGQNAIAASVPAPTDIGASQPTDGTLLVVKSSEKDAAGRYKTVPGDVAIPSDAQSQRYALNSESGFAITDATYSSSATTNIGSSTTGTGGGSTADSNLSFSFSSRSLKFLIDGDLFSNRIEQLFDVIDYSAGTATGARNFLQAKPTIDDIDLVSGIHRATIDFGAAYYSYQYSGTPSPIDTGAFGKVTTNGPRSNPSVSRAAVAGPASDGAAAESGGSTPPAIAASFAAAAPASNAAFIQFRDVNGNIIPSATGQQWFSLATSDVELRQVSASADRGQVQFSDLGFSIAQNAIVGTLDTALAAGTPLNAEVASYAGGVLQSDYVFGGGRLTGHALVPDSNAQLFTLSATTFQETEYSSGAAAGTLTYDRTSKISGTTVNAPINAPSAPPEAVTAPAATDSYVQFISSGGVPLTGSGGATFFKVSELTTSFTSDATGATTFDTLSLHLGSDFVTSRLDGAFLNGTALSRINVATYNAATGAFEASQQFSGSAMTSRVRISSANVDNVGGDHAYEFTYTGYGETIAGSNPLNFSSAVAGTATNPPLANTTAMTGSANPPSLGTLSYYAELKTDPGRAEVFAGTPSGFVGLQSFSLALPQPGPATPQTATFVVDRLQAAVLADRLDRNINLQLEIAGYDSSGLAIDYILRPTALTGNSVDPSTGLDTVTISYNALQVTQPDALGRQTTVNKAGSPTYALDAPQNPPTVCFCSGTLIRTARGDVPVEHLAVGDLAVTASGAQRPIRWIGHRAMHLAGHPEAHRHHPVRVRAGAFGPDLPRRDLLLSPGHSIRARIVDDVFVPVGSLVNGATIVREPVDSVTYWHVELDSHDVLLAENLPCESFLDCGNRDALREQEGTYDRAAAPGTPADFCLPYVADGLLVEALRHGLETRALRRGWQRSGLDPHLVVDGARIDGLAEGDTLTFVFPAAAQAVTLISATVAPSEHGPSFDSRRLGLSVRRLAVGDGLRALRDLPAADPVLASLFHPEEAAGRAHHRFTTGTTTLARALWEGCRGVAVLRLTIDAASGWRWAPPDVVAPTKRTANDDSAALRVA